MRFCCIQIDTNTRRSQIALRAPSAEGETKTHAGSIDAALLERAEEFVEVPTWQTAAHVLELDEHALGARTNPQRDGCRNGVD